MGVTYKALDVDLRCPVTLKVISEKYLGDESARLRFLREARAAASVRHPNVASVFHLGKSGDNYFYAMEFVEGETLENLVRRTGRLDVKLALEIATQVAGGVAAVHKKGLVHRDIKPSNIMVKLDDAGTPTAKIIDPGKTNTLAARMAWLVSQGIDPGRIMLLTFTRRASEEMLRRPRRALGETGSRTLGAVCLAAEAARDPLASNVACLDYSAGYGGPAGRLSVRRRASPESGQIRGAKVRSWDLT